jgi:hypothetical protein
MVPPMRAVARPASGRCQMFVDLVFDAGSAGNPRGSALITGLLLVGFLIAKEAVTAVPDRRGRVVGRVFDVVLVSLLIVLATIIALPLIPAIP